MQTTSRRTVLSALLFFSLSLCAHSADFGARPTPCATKWGFSVAAGLGIAATGWYALFEHLISKQGDRHHDLVCRLDAMPLEKHSPADTKALADSLRKLKRLQNWQKVSYWLAGGAAAAGVVGTGALYLDSQKAQAEAAVASAREKAAGCRVTMSEDEFAGMWIKDAGEDPLRVDARKVVQNQTGEVEGYAQQLAQYRRFISQHNQNSALLALIVHVPRDKNASELTTRRIKQAQRVWHPDKGHRMGAKCVKMSVFYELMSLLQEKAGRTCGEVLNVTDQEQQKKVRMLLDAYVDVLRSKEENPVQGALSAAGCTAKTMLCYMQNLSKKRADFTQVLDKAGSGSERVEFLQGQWGDVSRFLNAQLERVADATDKAAGLDDTHGRRFYRWLTGRPAPTPPMLSNEPHETNSGDAA